MNTNAAVLLHFELIMKTHIFTVHVRPMFSFGESLLQHQLHPTFPQLARSVTA